MNNQSRLDFFAELIGTFIFIGTIITVINSIKMIIISCLEFLLRGY